MSRLCAVVSASRREIPTDLLGSPVKTGMKCQCAARADCRASNLTGQIQIHGVYRCRQFRCSKQQGKGQLVAQPHPGPHPTEYKTAQVLLGQTTFDVVRIQW